MTLAEQAAVLQMAEALGGVVSLPPRPPAGFGRG